MGTTQIVFSHGMDLYTFLGPVPAYADKTWPLNAFKSSDNGVTWSIVDGSNSPALLANDSFYESSSVFAKVKAGDPDKILIPYVKWIDLPLGQPGGEMCFVEFDMSTDTWGVPVTGGPLVMDVDASDMLVVLVIGQYVPSTGEYVFVYQARMDPLLPQPRNYKPVFSDMVTYSSGGGWGVPTQFAGVSGVTTHNCVPRDILIDPATNKLHIFWVTQDWGDTSIQFQKLYHQLYDPSTHTLGSPELMPTGTGVYGEPDAGLGVYYGSEVGVAVGRAILTSGGYIAIPIKNDRAVPNELYPPLPQAIVVAPLSDSPTWSFHPVTPDLSDQVVSNGWETSWQIVDKGGGQIRGYWPNTSKSSIQYADFDIGSMTWGAPQIAYTAPTDSFGDYFTAANIQDGNVGVLASYPDMTGSNHSLVYWQFSLSSSPPSPSSAAAGTATVTPGGSSVWPPIFRYPNEYDKCLERWKCVVRSHPIKDVSRCVKMVELWGGSEVPTNAKEFWEAFKIVTPAPGQDYLVGSFRVPNGYSGMLYGVHVGYTGTGFVDGSGDIIWRIMIGNAWAAPGLGRITTKLGSPYQLLQITDYIKLKSSQIVSVLVNVPNTSGSIQVGTSRILSTLQGWYYPMK
jgi:hypothetical protein